MKIKVLAIDDEPLALMQLEKYISRIPQFELTAKCLSAAQAKKYIDDIDAVFIDINMPDCSGLDFIRSLENPPLVVFTTAYPQYAVDGFRVNATDYLLKPLGFKEFEEAAKRIVTNIELRLQNRDEEKNNLIFKADHKTMKVNIDQIRYVQSMAEYVKIHIDGEDTPLVVHQSMKSMEAMLPDDKFVRVHRSYIVSLGRIRKVGGGIVILDGEEAIPLGKLYRDGFKSIFS